MNVGTQVNIWIQFSDHTVSLIHLSFTGRPLYAELSPVTDFREACCRQNENGECNRGGFCNFMHLRLASKELVSSLRAGQRLERRLNPTKTESGGGWEPGKREGGRGRSASPGRGATGEDRWTRKGWSSKSMPGSTFFSNTILESIVLICASIDSIEFDISSRGAKNLTSITVAVDKSKMPHKRCKLPTYTLQMRAAKTNQGFIRVFCKASGNRLGCDGYGLVTIMNQGIKNLMEMTTREVGLACWSKCQVKLGSGSDSHNTKCLRVRSRQIRTLTRPSIRDILPCFPRGEALAIARRILKQCLQIR